MWIFVHRCVLFFSVVNVKRKYLFYPYKMDFVQQFLTQRNIHMFHALFAGPLLAYTGYQLNAGKTLDATHKLALLVVGILATCYHSMKSYQKWQAGASWKDDYHFQVNLAHALFIGPLVAWVGYKLQNGRRATQLEKNILLFLGLVAIAYHAYSFYKLYIAEQEN